MKKLIAMVLAGLLSGVTYAGVSPDIHILQNVSSETGTPDTTITGEVFWSDTDTGTFGLSFVDVYSGGSLTYFTNNVVNKRFGDSPFYAGIEFGARGVRGGDDFLPQGKIGLGVTLTDIPVLEKVLSPMFVVLGATYYEAYGEDVDQWKINWKTRSWNITPNLEVYSSGFFRIREGAPDVCQPQGWGKHVAVPSFEGGFEENIFGKGASFHLGFKYTF